MNALGQTSSPRTCTPAFAIEKFLALMHKVATATFPAWQEVLKAGIDDCKLPYDARRAVFEIQPIADYYFAGVVGLEAALQSTMT